jgi:hypothetical protein
MKDVSEYDKRQLRLMHESLVSFENQRIGLNSLIGTLEFLLSSLEAIDNDLEEKISQEITTLESINALEIIKDSGEEISKINEKKKGELVSASTCILKLLIANKLNSIEC